MHTLPPTTRLLRALIAAVVLWAMGCATVEPPECESDDDCPTGEVCQIEGAKEVGGVCIEDGGHTDHDAGIDDCDVCGTPECPCEAGEPCQADEQCADGSCVDGICGAQRGCDGDNISCGDVCVDVTQHPDHCGGCDVACEDDEICSDGDCVCEADCCSDADCPDRHVCRSGTCEELLPYLRSASRDDTLRKIDQSPGQVWTYGGHTHWVRRVFVDPDANAYTVSYDGTVRKTDADGEPVWQYDTGVELPQAMAVGPSGEVFTEQDGAVAQRIDADGHYDRDVDPGGSGGSVLAADADQNLFAADGHRLHKYDQSGSKQWTYDEHTDDVVAITAGADGHVYTGTDDGEVHKIDTGGNRQWLYTNHTDSVHGVAVDADGYVYTASDDKTVRKITDGGQIQWIAEEFTDEPIRGIAVDPYGQVYAASNDAVVRKFSEDGQQLWEFDGHVAPVRDVAVEPGPVGVFPDAWEP